MKFPSTIIAFIGILSLGACSNAIQPDVVEEKRVYPEGPVFSNTEKTRAEAVQNFGIRMLNVVSDKELKEESNLIFSPLSASIMLSMIANASDEEASKEIIEAMEFPGTTTVEELNEFMKKIVLELPHDVAGSLINFSNGFWYSTNTEISNSFDLCLKNVYDCTSQQLDFSDISNYRIPNAWVQEKSKGKISGLPINERDFDKISWIVANIMCFEAEWDKPFRESDTHNAIFHNLDGSECDVRMMKGEQPVSMYMENDEGEFVEIGYDNPNLKLTVYIPYEVKEGCVSDFSKLDFNTFGEKAKNILQGKTVIHLPKFQFNDGALHLNNIFKELGIKRIFDKSISPLSHITTKDGNKVPDLIQNVRFLTSEKGVEAVAVSSTGIITDCFSKLPAEIKIDRPFVFSITAYGLPLIYGRISNLGKE